MSHDGHGTFDTLINLITNYMESSWQSKGSGKTVRMDPRSQRSQQGCVLFPYLFNILAEMMMMVMRDFRRLRRRDTETDTEPDTDTERRKKSHKPSLC